MGSTVGVMKGDMRSLDIFYSSHGTSNWSPRLVTIPSKGVSWKFEGWYTCRVYGILVMLNPPMSMQHDQERGK